MAKNFMVIAVGFALCGAGLCTEGEQKKLTVIVQKESEDFTEGGHGNLLTLRDGGSKQSIGSISYYVNSENAEADFGILRIGWEYQKTGLGKLLAILGFADIVNLFSSVARMTWCASTSGYMTGKELRSFYSNLGGNCAEMRNHGGFFELDVRQMKEKNSLFDFKKMAEYARDGATFTFDPLGHIKIPVKKAVPDYYYVDHDGNLALKSRF